MLYDGWLDIKDWMRARALVYEKYSKRLPNKDDDIGISMKLEECGWLDMSFYKNGKRVIELPLSFYNSPLLAIVKWLERVIELHENEQLEDYCRIDCEQTNALLHFDIVEVPWCGLIDDFRGIFIVYGDWTRKPKWNEKNLSAIVSIQDLVSSIYNSILNFFAPLPNRKYSEEHIVENWMMANAEIENSMEVYNEVKSPKLECFIAPKDLEGWFAVDFRKYIIKQTILMEARPEGLFWNQENECIGNHKMLHIGKSNIDLSDIQDLAEWYSELTTLPPADNYDWFDKGYLLAMQIRNLMPKAVDLFYVNYKAKYKKVSPRYLIVPDKRQGI